MRVLVWPEATACEGRIEAQIPHFHYARGTAACLPSHYPPQEREEERGAEGSEDVTAASVVSLPASSVAAPSSAAASSEAAAPSSPTERADDSPSSAQVFYPAPLDGLLSAGRWGSAGSGAGGGGSGGLAPRTPHGDGAGLAPADVVAPMRDFASEVAAEVGGF